MNDDLVLHFVEEELVGVKTLEVEGYTWKYCFRTFNNTTRKFWYVAVYTRNAA